MLTPAQRADRCAGGLRSHWRTQCAYIAGAETAERDGILITATKLAETLSCAFVTRPLDDPAATLDWCVAWFRERGLTTGVEVRVGEDPATEHELRQRAFRVVVTRPAMALYPLAPPAVPTPPRVTVRRVENDADLDAFQLVQAEAFDMTPDVAAAFLPRHGMETPGIGWFLALHDDVPCATAAASVSAYGAGVVGVATLPAYRRRGIARAVTAAAVAYGASEGADLAWLFPTAMARRLYASLGFETLRDHAVWVLPC